MEFLRLFVALSLALFPTRLVRPLAWFVGHRIAPTARIGFSLVLSRRVVMGEGCRIGHLSIVKTTRLLMRNGSSIGHLNKCYGPLSISLGKDAALGNRNSVTRAPHGVTSGPARLMLGELSKITSSHMVDCTSSVVFDDFSILAGQGSQIWTHGYVHEPHGAARYRVDGPVHVGRNVYIGAGVIITGGVTIADEVMVGVGVPVAKSLMEPGFYVAGPLRQLPRPVDPATRSDMYRVEDPALVETVYRKHARQASR